MKTAALALAATLALSLAGCSSDDPADPASTPHTTLVTALPVGTVEGRFVVVGGPAPGDPRPLAGRLTITGTDGSVVHADIGSDGRYAIQLSPGDYRLTASSSGYSRCETSPPVTTLVAGKTVQADVTCDVP